VNIGTPSLWQVGQLWRRKALKNKDKKMGLVGREGLEPPTRPL
jgi:hypothetical protein